MKIEWLVADVTSVESPDRAEHASLGLVFAGRFFWSIHAIFVAREPLSGIGTPS